MELHLTRKQRDFLTFLRAYVEENMIWPTYREIADTFGYRSPNSVTQNLQALYKKGVLEKTDVGYDFARTFGGEADPVALGIPIRGIITAGKLQEAVEANLGTIGLETLFPNMNRMFAIRVSGQSMQGADINDGDYVLLVDDDIPNGGIGAVLYNGETSLKRIYHGTDGLRLEPANDDYPDIHIRPDIFEEVRVLGKYVGHVNASGIHKKPGSYTRRPN